MKTLLVSLLAMILLVGCSSNEPAEKAKEKPAAPKTEEITGRAAFQKLYVAAHGWAGDARPYRLESGVTKESTGKDGKAAVWRGSFASQMRRAIKAYVWSGTSSEGAPSPGISPGTEDTYNPSNTNTQIFDAAFLKIDSDKAFEVAQKHGGDKLLQKNPKQPIVYVLDWSPRSNELVWHVIYGTDRENSTLRVAVDATSGDFLRLEK